MFVKIAFLGNLSKIFFKEYYYLYLHGDSNTLEIIIDKLCKNYPNLKFHNFISCINDNCPIKKDTLVFDNDIITLIPYINND